MPNLDQIKKMQERREARAAGKANATDAAEQELHALAAKSEEQSQPDFVAPKRKAVPDRKAQIAARRAAAEAQAELDAAYSPPPTDAQELFAKAKAAGGEIPLHVLNAMAKEASANIRDEAVEIGRIAGKAARDAALVSRPERSRHNRIIKAAKAAAAMAAVDKQE